MPIPKKLWKIEKLKRLLPIELCESCMANYQKLKILQMPMPNVIKLLEKLYIDIQEPLSVTFSEF